MMKLFLSPSDAYQLLAGGPGGAGLPLVSSSRRLQLLRSKRLSTRSGSGSGAGAGGAPNSWLLKRASSGQSSLLCGVLVVVPWLTLILLGVLLWRVRLHGNLPPVVQDIPGGRQCLGWKETFFCHPFAERFSLGDKGCDEVIGPHVSGYCLCEGNVTTARVTCGPKSFTCRQRCMELGVNPTDGLELPAPATCPYAVPYDVQHYMPGMQPPPANWAVDVAREHERARDIWQQVTGLIRQHGLGGVRAPGVRNETHDFALEGRRMPRDDVAYVAGRTAAFKAAIPAYPADAFHGRGVVMIGGGLRYMFSAWVAVHLLRSTGCSLPIEMWYPTVEAPSDGAAAAFASLGVSTRLLDMPGFNLSRPFSKEAESTDHNMGRFTIKAAVLLLTRFREVVYLDADSFVLKDPSSLFDSPQYNETAAIFWQDYWGNTLAPEVAELLGVPREAWPSGSFESGQMVLDKARHWRGLVLAMYLNSYSSFWYEMFTCYLGKGDKETFAYALAAAGEPYSLVRTPPRAIGTTGTSESCNSRTNLCTDEFTGNTMGQAGLDGELMFLHSNMHKWDLRLPQNFVLHYQRRWMRMLPENVDFEAWQLSRLGFDLERRVYDLLRQLKCLSWWGQYYAARVAAGDRKSPELDGFHFLLRGIDLRRMYEHGWPGNYAATIAPLYPRDWRARARHAFNGGLRWRLVGWRLVRHKRPG